MICILKLFLWNYLGTAVCLLAEKASQLTGMIDHSYDTVNRIIFVITFLILL